MMKPLEQWVCDKCGGVIASVEDGWLEWLHGGGKAHSFRIVHHASASPLGPDRDCYHHSQSPECMDNHLEVFVGSAAMPSLLRFIDMGPLHDPDEQHLLQVKNVRELVEIVRRLMIPHYEEARLYWADADADGFFDGANEIWPYLPHNLEALIKRYRDVS